MNTRSQAGSATTVVLLTLCAGQFLMTLDSSVMNVSIATVAKDVGTDVTGIQTAITLYTLVMASLMITGGKIGELIGRRRAFQIGCVIYGVGSFTTAIAPTLGVLLIGWSFLEGVGAALIMPAIVALVASNFPREGRPRAYGLVASAGAIAVAAGPLIGGFFTTYLSWRLVFAGEVIVVLGILLLSRKMADAPPSESTPASTSSAPRCRPPGWPSSSSGSSAPASGELCDPSRTHPSLGLSPVIWLLLGGGVVVWLFLVWEQRRDRSRRRAARRPGPAPDPALPERPHRRSSSST